MSQSNLSPDAGSRSRWTRIVVSLAIAALLAVGFVYWAFYQREHHLWNENIELLDGQTLKIHQHSSNQAYHGLVGHGSPFWWGGGDPWHATTFSSGVRQYHWEGPYIPIVIQPDKNGRFYIVVYDRESEDANQRLGYMFRIYRSRSDGSFEEIPPVECPKFLAVQNTWLRPNGSIDDHDLVKRMDPSEPWFRRSLTASLWAFLENPNDKSGQEPSEAFVRQYKDKWITIKPTITDGLPGDK